MDEDELEITAANYEDAIKALSYARQHSKKHNLGTDFVPSLFATTFGQGFRPHLSMSAMKEIVRAYYVSINSYAQYDWVKSITLTTKIKCWNFGITVGFKEEEENIEEE